MKNYEKYADEIREYIGDYFCTDFVRPNILKTKHCVNMNCDVCQMLQTIWLMEEYEEPKEPEVDWSKVEVDTPILVKDYEDEAWGKRYFAKYENGAVYAWANGCTSWSSGFGDDFTKWEFAKLAESE